MKNIIAIIRNECVEPSRSALEQIGVRGVAFLQVMWQKRQGWGTGISPLGDRGHLTNPDRLRHRHTTPPGPNSTVSADAPDTESLPEFLPKTMLIMAVIDEDVLPVIQALVRINQSGYPGDGRIFVCPMVTTIGIGTGKSGDTPVL